MNVQFVDGATGKHLYAQRYDRKLDDVFALQDELVDDIVGAIEPGIGRIDRMSVTTKPPDDLTAWECTKRGMVSFYRGGREDLREARKLFARAIELDPHLAAAWAGVSQALCAEFMHRFAADPDAALAEAIRTAERAMGEDPADALGPSTLAFAYTLTRDVDRAVELFERALELNPSHAPCYWGLGAIRLHRGESAEARRLLELAIRLSPHDPVLNHMECFLASAHAAEGDLEQALAHARRSAQLRPDQPFAPVIVAACAGHLGRLDEAREARDVLAALAPGFGPGHLRLFLNAELVGLFEAGWRRLDSPGR